MGRGNFEISPKMLEGEGAQTPPFLACGTPLRRDPALCTVLSHLSVPPRPLDTVHI